MNTCRLFVVKISNKYKSISDSGVYCENLVKIQYNPLLNNIWAVVGNWYFRRFLVQFKIWKPLLGTDGKVFNLKSKYLSSTWNFTTDPITLSKTFNTVQSDVQIQMRHPHLKFCWLFCSVFSSFLCKRWITLKIGDVNFFFYWIKFCLLYCLILRSFNLKLPPNILEWWMMVLH